MSRAIEAFRSARKRINPEGLAVGTTLSAVSPAVMIPMEAGITYVIHEASKEVDPNILKFIAIGLLGVANIVSIATEKKTLQENQYSASPVGSTLNMLTGKPLIASIGEHAVNYAQLSVINPINAAAIIGHDSQLLLESAGATSLALTMWYTSMNTLILKGKINPVVDKLRSARQSIWQRIKRSS